MSGSQKYERTVLTDTKRRADSWIESAGADSSLTRILGKPEGKLLVAYMRPKAKTLGGIVAIGLFSTAMEAIRLIMLLFTLQLIVGQSGSELSDGGQGGSILGFGFSIPGLSDLNGTDGLIVALIGFGVATLLKEGADLTVNYLSATVQNAFMYEVRRDLLDKLLTLESSYFTESRAGDVAYLQNTIVNRFASLVPTVQTYMRASVDLLVSIGIMLLLSVPLTGVLVLLGGTFFGLTGIFRARTRRLSFEAESTSLEAATQFLETVQGIRLVKLGGQQTRVRDRYLELARNTIAALLRQFVYSGFAGAASRTGGVLVVLILAVGLSAFGGFDPEAGGAAALGFLTIALRATQNLSLLVDGRLRLASMLPQYMMIAGFLLDDRYVEASSLENRPLIGTIGKSIAVENVRFEYEPGEPVLDDLTLTFPRGSITAIVGASGSGKTTLVELLSGYRPVQQGRVLIDGHDLAEYDVNSYRDQIGYVTQDTIMFHDTLRQNLRFLRPDATDEEMQRALELAAADDFVDRRGLDAMLGERGMKLSGGQRQRIALARVILQDAPVLLLDEATSALDLYTEARVFENLMELRKDRIALVVAHRLSAITRFDRIVVMHKGKVVEQGSHHELLANRGLYFHLYGLQEYSPEASLAALADL